MNIQIFKQPFAFIFFRFTGFQNVSVRGESSKTRQALFFCNITLKYIDLRQSTTTVGCLWVSSEWAEERKSSKQVRTASRCTDTQSSQFLALFPTVNSFLQLSSLSPSLYCLDFTVVSVSKANFTCCLHLPSGERNLCTVRIPVVQPSAS